MRITRAGYARPRCDRWLNFALYAACNTLLVTLAVLGAVNHGGAV